MKTKGLYDRIMESISAAMADALNEGRWDNVDHAFAGMKNRYERVKFKLLSEFPSDAYHVTYINDKHKKLKPEWNHTDYRIRVKATGEVMGLLMVSRTNTASGNFCLKMYKPRTADVDNVMTDDNLTHILFYDDSFLDTDHIIHCYIVNKQDIIDAYDQFRESKSPSGVGLLIPLSWIKKNSEKKFWMTPKEG